MSMRMLPPATQSIHYHHGHLMLAPAVRLSAVRLHLTKAAGNVTLQPCAAHSSVVCSPLLQAMKPYAIHAALRQPTATECIRHSRRQ